MSITTVGYGDMSFQTVEGRALCTVWLLLSTVVTAVSVGVLASYRAEKWHHEMVSACAIVRYKCSFKRLVVAVVVVVVVMHGQFYCKRRC